MSVNWQGLEEFKAELRNLPDHLTTEAGREALAAANAAAVAIRSEYGAHAISGKLRDSVVVDIEEVSRYGVRAFVRSTDPIAWLWDYGSQVRHWISGSQKSTGRMPPSHTVGRNSARQRRRMVQRIIGIMERAGLKVSGDAG